MNRLTAGLFIASLLLAACAENRMDIFPVDSKGSPEFYASFEDNAVSGTKTYVDGRMTLRWTKDDRVSIFVGNTYNREYKYAGETGANNGSFSGISDPSFFAGEPLDANYAIYPYSTSNEMLFDGEITVVLPAVQNYVKGSFGLGANTMVAVTKDKNDMLLRFKNVCGYLVVRLYGQGKILSVKLNGNNGEKISGKASVQATYGTVPSITMTDDATTSITIDCGDGVELGSTSATATEFWFCIPPVMFKEGFSVTVEDMYGRKITKNMATTRSILRNTVNTISGEIKSEWSHMSSVDDMVDKTYCPYFFYGYSNQLEYDISYAGLQITYARMLNDFVNNSVSTGYDWWRAYAGEYDRSMKYDNDRQTVPYRTLYEFVESANAVIAPFYGRDDLSVEMKESLGSAYVYRALMYHDIYNMYLPALNKYTDCSAVDGLTAPIILSSAEKEPQSKSARAPKEAMFAQVIADLDKAEELFTSTGYVPVNNRYPSLAVVYGLKARMYMAYKDYAKAAEFARMAIQASGKTPLTEDQWLDPAKAFCDATGNNSWMWYYSISANNMGNLCNPTGFLAGEADWSYNSLTQMSIHKWLYDRLNRTDFRKKSFIDPDRETYPASYYKWASERYLSAYPFERLPDYMSFKIRCKAGDWETYSVGGAVDFPMMRVEEMYFIEAEAVGLSQSESAGIALLENFMQTYRDPGYSYAAAQSRFSEGFVKNFSEEVLYQKRVEFLGEGVGFFDAKRIRPGVITWYPGSNVIHATMKYEIEEVSPYWNFLIPQGEIENNEYIIAEGETPTEINGIKQTLNNPDPTNKVECSTEVFD